MTEELVRQKIEFPDIPKDASDDMKAFLNQLRRNFELLQEGVQYFDDVLYVAEKIVTDKFLQLKEITQPTAIADNGQIWTESDNTLHFQDGAGTEYTIDITPV